MIPILFALATAVATDFEAGNAGKAEWLSETHLRVAVPGETDQDGCNRQPSWFYFRIDGVRGRDLTVDLPGLAGEYIVYAPLSHVRAPGMKGSLWCDNGQTVNELHPKLLATPGIPARVEASLRPEEAFFHRVGEDLVVKLEEADAFLVGERERSERGKIGIDSRPRSNTLQQRHS